MARTNQERVTAHRQRQKEGVEVPQCDCGRLLKGELSQRRRICQRCFLYSPDGKHRAWVRVNDSRGREVIQEHLPEWGDWKVGDKAIAPDGSIGEVQAIALYINGGVQAIVQFEHDSESFLISSLNPLITN
jgi:hypothetical protein